MKMISIGILFCCWAVFAVVAMLMVTGCSSTRTADTDRSIYDALLYGSEAIPCDVPNAYDDKYHGPCDAIRVSGSGIRLHSHQMK